MHISLTTPALLFPAISLLLLAYTNRFITLANLIRNLHRQYQEKPSAGILGQIQNLRRRVGMIQRMQAAGIASLFLCVLCMLLLFAGWVIVGEIIFGLALVLMMASLGISFREIQVSVDALNLHLQDIEEGASGKLPK
jgi:hypothetical protein